MRFRGTVCSHGEGWACARSFRECAVTSSTGAGAQPRKVFTPAAPAPPPEWTGGFGGAARSEAGFVLDAMSPTLTSVSPKGQQPPPRVPGPARPRDRAGCRGPSRLTPAFFFFFFFSFLSLSPPDKPLLPIRNAPLTRPRAGLRVLLGGGEAGRGQEQALQGSPGHPVCPRRCPAPWPPQDVAAGSLCEGLAALGGTMAVHQGQQTPCPGPGGVGQRQAPDRSCHSSARPQSGRGAVPFTVSFLPPRNGL